MRKISVIRTSVSIWLVAALLVGGCAERETLESRDGAVPVGINLSGNWTIQSNQREDERRLREAIRKTDGLRDEQVYARSSGSRDGRFKGGLVFVFLETGAALKVTQTDSGLFISFDRSVVEEYRFGENRMISVGQVEAQRVTGWDGAQLIIETLDRNSMKLIEKYRLLGSGNILEREITLRSKDGLRESVIQRFDRQRT